VTGRDGHPAAACGDGAQPAIASIGVGMLGYGFMGKAHANAYRTLPYMMWPPPLLPRLVTVAGRTEAAVAEAAQRYGFERYATDWRELVADDAVELFDNGGPNGLHAEPTIAAAEADKHVLCEKPLGRDADESYEMWRRVAAAGVKHMVAFNYRFAPAVRLARDLIAGDELGEIRHFRGRYLQDWIADPSFEMVWRLDRAAAGSGALGDLGAHVIDLARYLVGEIDAVSALMTTFVSDRPGGTVDVDDACCAAIGFANGAMGTIEASRFCLGHANSLCWEVNGSKGSVAFDLERINELQVHLERTRPGARAQGFRRVQVTEPDHPFMASWWPPGHVLGWEHTFVHEIHHLLAAIADDGDVAPHGATFEDGYRAAEVCDAIVRSSEGGGRETVRYRALEGEALRGRRDEGTAP
jgi:predicted dehydrogenase